MQTVSVVDGRPNEAELVPPLGADETYSFSIVGVQAQVFDRRPMTGVEKARRDLAALEASGTGSQAEFRDLCRLVRESSHAET